MSDNAEVFDLLPLLFFTGLVVYALALGSVDLARTAIRVAALFCLALCFMIWGVAALSYDTWGGPVIDDFYATTLLQRSLGARPGGWVLIVSALLPAAGTFFELWRRRMVRQQE